MRYFLIYCISFKVWINTHSRFWDTVACKRVVVSSKFWQNNAFVMAPGLYLHYNVSVLDMQTFSPPPWLGTEWLMGNRWTGRRWDQVTGRVGNLLTAIIGQLMAIPIAIWCFSLWKVKWTSVSLAHQGWEWQWYTPKGHKLHRMHDDLS